jgi:hypothetical protein
MEGMLEAAKGLAMTTLDLCLDEAFLSPVKADHIHYRSEAAGDRA